MSAPSTKANPSKPSRLRGLLKRVAALAIGCVVAGILAEVGVLLFIGEVAKFPRHVVEAPWGLRYNEPGASYRHKSADVTVRFRINSKGMRADREYSYEKPATKLRIISLGDSFTAGYEVDVGDCFSSVLERELASKGFDVEVFNAGVSGFSNAEECLYLERELLRYDPDLVLLSFYSNDLVDNVRTGLFELEGEELVTANERYVPGGKLANFLNTSGFFNLLSERSNAFVFVKTRLTQLLKRSMVEQNMQNLNVAAGDVSDTVKASSETREREKARAEQERYQRKLAAAILDRLYTKLHARGVPLVIQSIPSEVADDRLVDLFPIGEIDLERPGIAYLAMKPLLDPLVGKELIYHRRSHFHWTPRSHAISGKALAELIVSGGFLKTR